jgi:hypothetical protein
MRMLRHIRNGIIRSASLLGISWIYRMYQKRKGPLVRIVVFHDVADATWFRTIVMCMRERYHIISPQDFTLSRFHPLRINVLITFDDGYSSWVDVCAPILEEMNIKALFFINSGLIDVSTDSVSRERYVRDRLLLSPRAILSWDGVKTLQGNGHTIGGHTVTHTRLSLLQEREQRDEILNDKDRIESHIGKTLTMFAYPFGQKSDYTQVTERLMKESGYHYTYTTEGVFADLSRPYALSRLCLESNMSAIQMCTWIDGGYDIYQKMKSICVR